MAGTRDVGCRAFDNAFAFGSVTHFPGVDCIGKRGSGFVVASTGGSSEAAADFDGV